MGIGWIKGRAGQPTPMLGARWAGTVGTCDVCGRSGKRVTEQGIFAGEDEPDVYQQLLVCESCHDRDQRRDEDRL